MTSHRIGITAGDCTSRRSLALLSVIALIEMTVDNGAAATVELNSSFAVQKRLFATRSDFGQNINAPPALVFVGIIFEFIPIIIR